MKIKYLKTPIQKQKTFFDEELIEKFIKAPKLKQKKDELADKVGAASDWLGHA
jgi:hypothetical protein